MQVFQAWALALLFCFSLSLDPSASHAASHETVHVKGAWVRITIPGRPAAAYMNIHNMGEKQDKLVGVKTAAAKKAELHTHVMDSDVMQMRKVDSVDIPAKGMAEFKPGGHHIMLFGLAEELEKGDKVPLTLIFEQAGDVQITVVVQDKAPEGMDHGSMSHGSGN